MFGFVFKRLRKILFQDFFIVNLTISRLNFQNIDSIDER